MSKANRLWKVEIDFMEDGEENFDTVEVEARTEEVALEKAQDQIHAMYDVEEIIGTSVRDW